MNSFLFEINRKFPLLDIDLGINADAIIAAGYAVVCWPNTSHDMKDFMKYISAVSWCRETFPDSCHCASNMFWFADKDEATLFKLIWM